MFLTSLDANVGWKYASKMSMWDSEHVSGAWAERSAEREWSVSGAGVEREWSGRGVGVANCVTKVDVTRCGDWWCHRSFTSKTDDLFTRRHQSHTLRLSMWSFVQCSCKFSRKQILTFSLVCHPPGWCHVSPGAVRHPPPPAVSCSGRSKNDAAGAECGSGGWSTRARIPKNVDLFVGLTSCYYRHCALPFREGKYIARSM